MAQFCVPIQLSKHNRKSAPCFSSQRSIMGMADRNGVRKYDQAQKGNEGSFMEGDMGNADPAGQNVFLSCQIH
ncbi:hypothetical protein OsJ_13760 [Oryza sativa Japonica Group]|uniref:Uncharacterized protein n=1 Tax=Oryza sativa subsp. japonica TaxID=39947 RepID=A3AQV5_ORYSJ|nr:hypothetical protein OsJ_13760 [Oryza sativa Japonica Group]